MDGYLAALDQHAPARLRQLAEDDLGQLRTSRPDEPGKPDDLARVHVEAHAAVPVAVQVFDAQDLVVAGRGLPPEDIGELPPYHQAHDLGVIQLAAGLTAISRPSRRIATRSQS